MPAPVLDNLWAWSVQVALLAGAGSALPWLARIHAPGARLAWHRALLVVSLALPLLQPWNVIETPPGGDAAPQVGAAGESFAGADSPAASGPSLRSPTVAPAVSRWWSPEAVGLVYLAGFSARLGWLALGLVSLARLRRRSNPLDPRPTSIDEAARAVGADAAFAVSSAVGRPVTFGLHRPTVFVPPSFDRLDPAQQSVVAMHELLHVRRRDWPRTIADELVRAVLWFHPAIWWLLEQIHLATEQVIDRRVVTLAGEKRPYLEALLTLAAVDSAPALRPASAFLKHGHLARRVALLVRDVPMSRARLVCSFAAVTIALLAGSWWVVGAYPLTARVEPVVLPPPPARLAFDPTTGSARWRVPPPPPPPPTSGSAAAGAPATGRTAFGAAPSTAPRPLIQLDEAKVAEFSGRIAANPDDVSYYWTLAKVYEDAGHYDRAAEVHEQAVTRRPNDPAAFLQQASFYNRRGDFQMAIEVLARRAAINPDDPEPPYTLATYYWDRAFRDQTLSDASKRELIAAGLEHVDRALLLRQYYAEAMIYKSLLLRSEAQLEQDPVRKQALVDEANRLRDAAAQLKKHAGSGDVPENGPRR